MQKFRSKPPVYSYAEQVVIVPPKKPVPMTFQPIPPQGGEEDLSDEELLALIAQVNSRIDDQDEPESPPVEGDNTPLERADLRALFTPRQELPMESTGVFTLPVDPGAPYLTPHLQPDLPPDAPQPTAPPQEPEPTRLIFPGLSKVVEDAYIVPGLEDITDEPPPAEVISPREVFLAEIGDLTAEESGGLIYSGLEDVVEEAYLAPQLQDFNADLHYLPERDDEDLEEEEVPIPSVEPEIEPAESDRLIYRGLEGVVEDAYLAPQLQDFNADLHYLPERDDEDLKEEEVPIPSIEPDAEPAESDRLIYQGLEDVVDDAYLAPQLQDFNADLHYLPERDDEDLKEEEVPTPSIEPDLETEESGGLIYGGLEGVVEDAYLAPQLQDLNADLHMLPEQDDQDAEEGEEAENEPEPEKAPIETITEVIDDNLIIAALEGVVEDTYLAPQLQDLNADLRFMPALAADQDDEDEPDEDELSDDDDLIYTDFDDTPEVFSEDDAIEYEATLAEPIQYAKPRFSAISSADISTDEDEEADTEDADTESDTPAEETPTESAASVIEIEAPLAEPAAPVIEEIPAETPDEPVIEEPPAEAASVSEAETTEAPLIEPEEETPVEEPVYLYRLALVVTPEIDAQVREIREAVNLAPMESGFFMLCPEFYCDDLELLLAVLHQWADQHLPLDLSLDQVEAETIGAQRYVAGWFLEPEETFIEVQQSLVDAISPHLNSEESPVIAARLVVGDHLEPTAFPRLVRELHLTFEEPVAWTWSAIELLRAPETDRIWEAVESIQNSQSEMSDDEHGE